MIALVRHPAVDAGGRCYGRLDVPLAAAGSAGALAAKLAPLGGTVWTSPARRCRTVAEAVGAHRVDDRLQELDFGRWEGLAWDDVPRAALDAWASDPWAFVPPSGESVPALVARVRAFAETLVRGDHVVISHGGPLKILAALLEGRDIQILAPPPPVGSITVIRQGVA